MSRHIAFLMTLALSTSAFAEPVLYVCERPAWEGKEGCGPNNTYYTYNLLVETRDFDTKRPEYEFRMRKGCDASKGRRQSYPYAVLEDEIVFWFKQTANASNSTAMPTIRLNRESMKAVMSRVEHSPELTCRIEQS